MTAYIPQIKLDNHSYPVSVLDYSFACCDKYWMICTFQMKLLFLKCVLYPTLAQWCLWCISLQLIACDIDHIHQDLVGWKDPDKSYNEYNLIFDVPFKNMKRSEKIMESTQNLAKIMDHKDFKVDNVEMVRPIFSTIKQWPPTYA